MAPAAVLALSLKRLVFLSESHIFSLETFVCPLLGFKRTRKPMKKVGNKETLALCKSFQLFLHATSVFFMRETWNGVAVAVVLETYTTWW